MTGRHPLTFVPCADRLCGESSSFHDSLSTTANIKRTLLPYGMGYAYTPWTAFVAHLSVLMAPTMIGTNVNLRCLQHTQQHHTRRHTTAAALVSGVECFGQWGLMRMTCRRRLAGCLSKSQT